MVSRPAGGVGKAPAGPTSPGTCPRFTARLAFCLVPSLRNHQSQRPEQALRQRCWVTRGWLTEVAASSPWPGRRGCSHPYATRGDTPDRLAVPAQPVGGASQGICAQERPSVSDSVGDRQQLSATGLLCPHSPVGVSPVPVGQWAETHLLFLPFPVSVPIPLPGFSWDQHPNTLLGLEPLSGGQLPGPVPSCRWGGLAPVMPPRALAVCLQAVKGEGRDPEAPAAVCTHGCPWSPWGLMSRGSQPAARGWSTETLRGDARRVHPVGLQELPGLLQPLSGGWVSITGSGRSPGQYWSPESGGVGRAPEGQRAPKTMLWTAAGGQSLIPEGLFSRAVPVILPGRAGTLPKLLCSARRPRADSKRHS